MIAPWVNGRIERRNRVLDRRLDAYSDLLEVAGRLHENAQIWSATPLAKDLEEPPSERIAALDARIRVVGSDAVVAATDRFARLSSRFHGDLFPARLRELAASKDQSDSARALAARMALGELADEMRATIKDLESVIRAEMKT